MGTAVVAAFIAFFSLLAAGALAIQVYGLTGRVKGLEGALDVERRHRERITGEVERLQDHAAGVPPEPQGPVVGVVVKNLGPWFKQ